MRNEWTFFRRAILLGMILLVLSCGVVSPNGAAAEPESEVLPALAAPSSEAVAYYVAPTGSDSNPGSLSQPFKSITKAIRAIRPGQVVYLRGGIYNSSGITLSGTGSATALYYIWAYKDEKPVLDFGGVADAPGVYITGGYWHLKGLEIRRAGKSGVRITGSHNIIEFCAIHNNGDAGLYIGINKGEAVNKKGLQAAYNQIVNCDSYLNYDAGGSTGPGGNADGFSCKLNAGKGNVFRGCRSWENSDDGWDLYLMNFQVVMENCWTWHNGDPASFGYTGSSWGGNGQGFKVGGGSASKKDEYVSHAPHILRNCIAFDIKYGSGSVRGFDRNNNMSGVTLYNCIAWNCNTGFYFSKSPDDGTHHLAKNCVAFNCSTNSNLSADAIHDHNSWDTPGVSAGSSDFQSLDVSLAKANRQADGSLPNNGFARLVAGSGLIDKGVNIGNPFAGNAPDLGAFEYGL